MNQNSGYWVLSGLMWIGFGIKAPALRYNRDPLYVTVCAVLFLAGLTFCCSNPEVVGALNQMTGIPNFSAPLVYSLLTLESALVLTLLVYWREGPPAKARRWARRLQAAYGLVILGIVTLFVAGEAPAERLVDFEVHYASTPLIREMVLLYLAAHIVASIMATVLCARWAASVTRPRWLRRGLRLLIIGFGLNLGVGLPKVAAMIGRWTGHNWDAINAQIFQLCAFACTLFTFLGFTLPMVGGFLEQLWSQIRAFRHLGPLWRALRDAIPGMSASLPVAWWDFELKCQRRVAEVQDGRLALRPFRSQALAVAAAAQAEAMNLPADLTEARVEAIVLADALARKAAGDELPLLDDTSTPLPRLDREALILVSQAIRDPLRNPPFTTADQHPLEPPAHGPVNA